MENLNSKLTAIILCQNESQNLQNCLASLKFCDQILVADDSSSDDSVKIAEHSGAQILHLEPTSSYAAKRNQAMQSVTDGWILFVDADEVVSPRLERQIQRLLPTTKMNGFWILRKDIFLGKRMRHGETGGVCFLRLAKVGKGEWKRQVHEVWMVEGKIGWITKGALIHTPHASLESFLESINNYTDLEVVERYHGKRVYPLTYTLVIIQLFVFPIAKFIQNYFFKLGFLDGLAGLFQAYFMSLHSLLVRIKSLEYLRSL